MASLQQAAFVYDPPTPGAGFDGMRILWIVAVLAVAAVVAYAISAYLPKQLGGLTPSAPVVPFAPVIPANGYNGVSYGNGAGSKGPVTTGSGDSTVAPLGYYPFSRQLAANYDAQYPESEQPQSYVKTRSLDPTGATGVSPVNVGGVIQHPYDTGSANQAGACGPGAAQAAGQLDLDKLVPSNWRGTQDCASPVATDKSNWAKFAPTREAFNQYITAAGSARLGINTRNPLSRRIGTPLLLREGPSVPMSTTQIPFNDSAYRNDLIYNSTGFYPKSGWC